MLAIKENKQYTITESEAVGFQKEGYDIYADDGSVYAYGSGKSVPYDKYMKLMLQVESMQDEIIGLKEELAKAKDEKKSDKKKG